MSFIEFLIDNYLWLIIMIVVIIVTLIGFIADNKSKSKKKNIEKKDINNESKQINQPEIKPEVKIENQGNNTITNNEQPIYQNNNEQIEQLDIKTEESKPNTTTIFSIENLRASQIENNKEEIKEPGEFTMDLSNALNSSFNINNNQSVNGKIINPDSFVLESSNHNENTSFITDNNEQNVMIAEKVINEEMWKL